MNGTKNELENKKELMEEQVEELMKEQVEELMKEQVEELMKKQVEKLVVELVEKLVDEKKSKSKEAVLLKRKISRRKNPNPKKNVGMKTNVMRKFCYAHPTISQRLKRLGRMTLSYKTAEGEITEELEVFSKSFKINNL